MLLSERTQASIIAARLAGAQCEIDPDHLTDLWREYWDWCDRTPGATFEEFLSAFSIHSERDLKNCKLIAAVRLSPPNYEPLDQTIDALPDLTWLWFGWIPRGQITLLVGDPSAGKSYFTLDLARRVIDGEMMPDGILPYHPGPVLYVDGENRPMVLKQRVEPWTEFERLHFYYMLPAPNRMMINFDDPDECDRLLDRVFRLHPALIIIDSYGSVSLRGENAKEDVQRLLSFLTRVARDYDCAILIIHHLRKKMQAQLSLPGMEMTLSSVRGSGHITAMATNVLGLALSGADRNGPRLLQVVKNNLGKYPDPIGVEFHSWDPNPDVAVLSYGPAPAADDDRPQVDQCLDWLIDLLAANGPTLVPEILEDGEAEGFNRRMVYRAKKRAGADIKSTRRGPEAGYWELRDYTTDPVDDEDVTM